MPENPPEIVPPIMDFEGMPLDGPPSDVPPDVPVAPDGGSVMDAPQPGAPGEVID